MAKGESTGPDRDEERRKRLAIPDEAPAAAPAEPAGALEPYHVVGPGAAFFDGKAHGAGAPLMLATEDALSLGDVIAPGHVASPPATSEAKAGSYKITHVGSILRDGKMHGPGTVLKLTAAEVVDFADRIEAVA